MVSTDVHGDVRHPRCVSEALHHNLNGFQVAIELVRNLRYHLHYTETVLVRKL